MSGRLPGTQRWIAHFEERSFDLTAFRRANQERLPAADVTAIVADMERRVLADQAAFVAAIERLGGAVVVQWWLVNAAAFEIDPARLPDVQKLANVQRLEADRQVFPAIRTATNARNHNSDAVNASGQVGLGVATAIMDTGLDENMAASGRPHRSFFVNGDPTNLTGGGMGGSRLVVNRLIGTVGPDDPQGHGTGVASIAAGGGWVSLSADAGHAPRAQIAGYGISEDLGGGSTHATIATAWQAIAADRVALGIVSANNSYSGSPDPLAVSQQALDAAALNADILVCVGAGNDAATTASSQSCANGLAVAALHADSYAVADFSSRGPLLGDAQRYYPDIAACGVDTVMAQRDAESADYVATGTSMAAPQVCGAATLIRAADPSMRADQTKAVLLVASRDVAAQNPNPPYNSRNAYGAGLLRDDWAMSLTQRTRGDHGRAVVNAGAPIWQHNATVTAGLTYRVAIAWLRTNTASTQWANLDVAVKQGNATLATSATPRNLYEYVEFVPTSTSVAIEVTATAFEAGAAAQDFGWALFALGVPPIAGQYTVFGAGCSGSGQGRPTCLSSNPDATTLSGRRAGGIGTLAWSFPAQTTNATVITGFEILTGGINQVASTALYLADPTGRPQGNPIATGTLTIGHSNGWYATTFSPTPIATGQHIAIEFSNTQAYLNAAVTGTLSPLYFRRPGESTFNGPYVTWPMAWRINCARLSGAIPELQATGVPEINSTFQVGVRYANPSSVAALLFGTSDQAWYGLTLPLDLTLLGAPNCFVRCSADVLLAHATNASGSAMLPIALPNSNALVGGVVFNQWLILDPANALGIVTSNGGRGTIGRP